MDTTNLATQVALFIGLPKGQRILERCTQHITTNSFSKMYQNIQSCALSVSSEIPRLNNTKTKLLFSPIFKLKIKYLSFGKSQEDPVRPSVSGWKTSLCLALNLCYQAWYLFIKYFYKLTLIILFFKSQFLNYVILKLCDFAMMTLRFLSTEYVIMCLLQLVMAMSIKPIWIWQHR